MYKGGCAGVGGGTLTSRCVLQVSLGLLCALQACCACAAVAAQHLNISVWEVEIDCLLVFVVSGAAGADCFASVLRCYLFCLVR